MALAGRLRQRRSERGWTKTELARRAGVDLSWVSRIENGRVGNPSAEVVGRLARALGTSVPDLLDLPEEAAPPAVPDALRRFAEEDGLPAEDVAMLARIRYRGEQPRTAGAWRFVYWAVKLAILDGTGHR